MKRAFIRGTWGIYDDSHALLARRKKIDGDIDRIAKCEFNEPFLTYVMGIDNLQRMKARGFDCMMIHKEPYMFDLIKFQYRHKMEIIRYAMEVDGYDEIVWLDWDCVPQKKLMSNFWEEMYKKGPFQACLQLYHRKKCNWREIDQRKVPNGGFIYIRDKAIPSKGIQYWDTIPQDNDEPAWAKLTDEMLGGWQGDSETMMTKYWDNFEPSLCHIDYGCPYSKERIESKDLYFKHFIK